MREKTLENSEQVEPQEKGSERPVPWRMSRTQKTVHGRLSKSEGYSSPATGEPEGAAQLTFPTRKMNVGTKRKMKGAGQWSEVEMPVGQPVKGCSKNEVANAT